MNLRKTHTPVGYMMLDEAHEPHRKMITGNYDRQVYEWIRDRAKPEGSLLDIGANIGYFTLAAVGFGMNVTAFEPFTSIRERLERNLALNDAAGAVFLRREAVGPTESEIQLGTATGHNATPRDEKNAESVPQIVLDGLYGVIDRPDMVKIDVEGGELGVLMGGRKFLEAWRPPIIIEVHQRVCSVPALVSVLSDCGYTEFTTHGKPIEGLKNIAQLAAE